MHEESRKTVNGMLTTLFTAALIVGANTAMAGEVDGNGNVVPGGENGRSECSYSGQQDNAAEDEGTFRGDRVQTWGQIPKWLREIFAAAGFHPGQACNPKKSGD